MSKTNLIELLRLFHLSSLHRLSTFHNILDKSYFIYAIIYFTVKYVQCYELRCHNTHIRIGEYS